MCAHTHSTQHRTAHAPYTGKRARGRFCQGIRCEVWWLAISAPLAHAAGTATYRLLPCQRNRRASGRCVCRSLRRIRWVAVRLVWVWVVRRGRWDDNEPGQANRSWAVVQERIRYRQISRPSGHWLSGAVCTRARARGAGSLPRKKRIVLNMVLVLPVHHCRVKVWLARKGIAPKRTGRSPRSSRRSLRCTCSAGMFAADAPCAAGRCAAAPLLSPAHRVGAAKRSAPGHGHACIKRTRAHVRTATKTTRSTARCSASAFRTMLHTRRALAARRTNEEATGRCQGPSSATRIREGNRGNSLTHRSQPLSSLFVL